MYLDSAYIAKYYVNEPDAPAVRKVIRKAPSVCSCSLALVEVTCALQRHAREGSLTQPQARELIDLFRSHVQDDVWGLLPMTQGLLNRAAALVRSLKLDTPLRAGDAIHLAAALEAGEVEIWTNDRHLLGAAAHVGLVGRSV